MSIPSSYISKEFSEKFKISIVFIVKSNINEKLRGKMNQSKLGSKKRQSKLKFKKGDVKQ